MTNNIALREWIEIGASDVHVEKTLLMSFEYFCVFRVLRNADGSYMVRAIAQSMGIANAIDKIKSVERAVEIVTDALRFAGFVAV